MSKEELGLPDDLKEHVAFIKQGESMMYVLAEMDNRIVEMQKSESCYVNVSVIRKMIADLKTEIEDMIYKSIPKR